MQPLHKILGTTLACLLIAGLGACGGAEPEAPTTPDGTAKTFTGKGDAWNRFNDPRLFRSELEYSFERLPGEGYAAKVPWADDYWPTYKDSINHRWQGLSTLSPAEKYDAAFNNWQATEDFMKLRPYRGFESFSYSSQDGCDWDTDYYAKIGPAASWVSQNKGNKSARKHRSTVAEGQRCGFGEETNELNGVETWWGLCHAWVPAAVLEDEPVQAVEHNGVRFEVSDLKALLIMQYDRSDAHFIGQRCNDKEITRDERGRVSSEDCRNVNAGTFHVIMTNFLGLQKRVIAADVEANYAVWNHPVTGYRITSQRELTLAQANELLRLDGPENAEQYRYNAQARSFHEVHMTYDYIVESQPSHEPNGENIHRYTKNRSLHYLVELDEGGQVIGGEWLGSSITAHPDFLWLPVGARFGNPHISLDKIRELVRRSRANLTPVDGAGTRAEALSAEKTERLEIPDNSPTGVTSTIAIDAPGVVKGITLDVKIRHSYRGDVRVELRRDNQTAVVFNGLGSANGWDDDVVLTGEVVSGFEGLAVTGLWQLVVFDAMAQDTGFVEGWSLRIER